MLTFKLSMYQGLLGCENSPSEQITLDNLLCILSRILLYTSGTPDKIWQKYSIYRRMIDLEMYKMDSGDVKCMASYSELTFLITDLI